MLGRLLVCAVALGTAMPACAGEESQPAATGERASYPTDALTLLLQDDRAIWGTLPPLNPLAPGYDMTEAITVASARPMASDLASFDALDPPTATFVYLTSPSDPRTVSVVPASFAGTPGLRLGPRYRAEPMGGSADAISESRAVLPRGHRRRRDPLAMILVFRIDGEESSPSLSFGGGVASVLNVLPRQ